MTPREWMLAILAGIAIVTVLLLWGAQRDKMTTFNLYDLIMEGGRVSKIAFSYMLVLAVTTWIMFYLTITGKMTEGYFISYGGLWVAPLVARMVSNNPAKGDTTVTTITQQTTETTPP